MHSSKQVYYKWTKMELKHTTSQRNNRVRVNREILQKRSSRPLESIWNVWKTVHRYYLNILKQKFIKLNIFLSDNFDALGREVGSINWHGGWVGKSPPQLSKIAAGGPGGGKKIYLDGNFLCKNALSNLHSFFTLGESALDLTKFWWRNAENEVFPKSLMRLQSLDPSRPPGILPCPSMVCVGGQIVNTCSRFHDCKEYLTNNFSSPWLREGRY